MGKAMLIILSLSVVGLTVLIYLSIKEKTVHHFSSLAVNLVGVYIAAMLAFWSNHVFEDGKSKTEFISNMKIYKNELNNNIKRLEDIINVIENSRTQWRFTRLNNSASQFIANSSNTYRFANEQTIKTLNESRNMVHTFNSYLDFFDRETHYGKIATEKNRADLVSIANYAKEIFTTDHQALQ